MSTVALFLRNLSNSLRKHPFLLALRRWGRFAEERGETDVFAGYLSNIRVTDSFKANGKREFVPRDQFFPLLVVTVHYFYANFSLTPVLSIKIVLDNFYLPTAHFLFCENFNLNLTFASASFRRH